MAKTPTAVVWTISGYVVVLLTVPDRVLSPQLQEFDYTSKFWQKVGISPSGPSARYGAVGGIDVRTTNPGVSLNNSFYMAGGYDGKTLSPLSEMWRLDVSGTLSSNNPNQVNASWTRVNVNSNIPGRVSVGGTVIGKAVVAVGGCPSATSTQSIKDSSCAVQDTQVIDASTGGVMTISPCLAPRIDPAVVPNMAGASSSFNQQAFVLLGTFNSTLWDDGNGLVRGEVVRLLTRQQRCDCANRNLLGRS